MRYNQIWTQAELHLLYKHWRRYNQRELQQKFFPNKTTEQVRAAKMHRGLKKPPVWTNKDREVMLTYGADYSMREMKERFLPNKTLSQITGMRKHLGVYRRVKAS